MSRTCKHFLHTANYRAVRTGHLFKGDSELEGLISRMAIDQSTMGSQMAERSLSDETRAHYIDLAKQIMHNLEFAHRWTELELHLYSDLTRGPLTRPLISGIPPQRLYVHPDEQAAIIAKNRKQNQNGNEADLKTAASKGAADLLIPNVREWVVPSHLREKVTLRTFAEVFDQIGLPQPLDLEDDAEDEEEQSQPWRKVKRLILATLSDDSTIVYYIVHDGLVKPRQN